MNQAPPIIHTLQVGLPRSLGEEGAADPMDRPWTTGLFKQPVDGPLHLGAQNLEGDGQADLHHHGGVDKAVCVYPLSRYPYWERRLERALALGAFGENFTVAGQDEDAVCLGDVYAVGEALVQVSQPRSPCWKLARRWRVPSLALWVQETGFTGWYLRVLQPGSVEAGQALVLRERPHPDWTITRLNAARFGQATDVAQLTELAACQALSENWRAWFRRRLETPAASDDRARLQGPVS